MIVEIGSNSRILPHMDNILEIHRNNIVLQELTPFNPMFAGGYPMALLFAPREKHDNLKIQSGYYADYDIYFSTEGDLEQALTHLNSPDCLPSPEYVKEKYVTDNAVSYKIVDTTNNITNLQLIKKVVMPPQVLLETFDFINCAVGFTPKNNSVFFHKETFDYHNQRVLEILKPWMLDEVSDTNTQNIVIQIARFKKYCMRWDYLLGSKAFDKLIHIYEKYPNIVAERNVVISPEPLYETPQIIMQEHPLNTMPVWHAYAGQRLVVNRNQNVWEVLAPLLKLHPKWASYKDPHEIIDNSTIATDLDFTTTEINREDVTILHPQTDDIPF